MIRLLGLLRTSMNRCIIFLGIRLAILVIDSMCELGFRCCYALSLFYSNEIYKGMFDGVTIGTMKR